MNAEPDLRGAADWGVWDEAFRRVESYLRAHGIESRVQLNALATSVIAAAQESARTSPAVPPVTLAMREADRRIGAWFTKVLGPEDVRDERFGPRGRLALIMADVPARWPEHFLTEEGAPDELVTAMRACNVQAGPTVRFTNMAPGPIEFPPIATTAAAWWARSRRPLMRAAAMWVLIIGLLGVTWAASH